MFVLNIIDCFTNKTNPVFALYCFYVVTVNTSLAENVNGDHKSDSWNSRLLVKY